MPNHSIIDTTEDRIAASNGMDTNSSYSAHNVIHKAQSDRAGTDSKNTRGEAAELAETILLQNPLAILEVGLLSLGEAEQGSADGGSRNRKGVSFEGKTTDDAKAKRERYHKSTGNSTQSGHSRSPDNTMKGGNDAYASYLSRVGAASPHVLIQNSMNS